MTIYLPADVAARLKAEAVTGKRPYERKHDATPAGYERLKNAEAKRRRRILARAR